MEKISKKDLKKKIVGTLEELLSGFHTKAADEINKSINSAGRELSKKFSKQIKKLEKQKPMPVKRKLAIKKSDVASNGRTVNKRKTSK